MAMAPALLPLKLTAVVKLPSAPQLAVKLKLPLIPAGGPPATVLLIVMSVLARAKVLTSCALLAAGGAAIATETLGAGSSTQRWLAGGVGRVPSVTTQLPLAITGVIEVLPVVAVSSVIEVLIAGATTPSLPVQTTETGKLLPVRSTGVMLADHATCLEMASCAAWQARLAVAGVLTWPAGETKSEPGVMVLVTDGVLMQAWRPASVLGHCTGTVMVQPPEGMVKPLSLMVLEPTAALRLPAVQVLLTAPAATTRGAGRLSVRFTLAIGLGVPLDNAMVKVAVLSTPPRYISDLSKDFATLGSPHAPVSEVATLTKD